MGWFSGEEGGFDTVSKLGQEQMPLYNQLLKSLQGPGAGGAFGGAADYYRNLLSNDSEDFESFANPEMRRFNQQIIPGIAEQFAGMGSGGLSSSGFRNAATQAGSDLSERLGAIRAQLRQQAAQGLTGLGQQGLQQYHENIYQPGTPGAAGPIGGLLGGLAGAFLGPMGSAAGSQIGSFMGNKMFGSTSPYGGQ